MNPFLLSQYAPDYRSMLKAATDTLWWQWKFFVLPYRVGAGLWASTLRGQPAPGQSESTPANRAEDEADSLARRAEERLRQGFAPPREIYSVQNRDRLDWSRLPGWARPVDPELFEGCGHEG